MSGPLKCWRAVCLSGMGHNWQWTSPSGAHSLLPAMHAPTQQPLMEPCCNVRVGTKRRNTGSFWKEAGVTSLSSLWRPAGGGAMKQLPSLTASLQHGLVQPSLFSKDPRSGRGPEGGSGCWRSLALGRLSVRSSRHRLTCGRARTALFQTGRTCGES